MAIGFQSLGLNLNVPLLLSMNGQVFPVDRERTSVGRTAGNDVVLSGSGLSRHHCELIRRQFGHEIRDLESTNAVWIHGCPWKSKILTDDTLICLGKIMVIYLPDSASRPPLVEFEENYCLDAGYWIQSHLRRRHTEPSPAVSRQVARAFELLQQQAAAEPDNPLWRRPVERTTRPNPHPVYHGSRIRNLRGRPDPEFARGRLTISEFDEPTDHQDVRGRLSIATGSEGDLSVVNSSGDLSPESTST